MSNRRKLRAPMPTTFAQRDRLPATITRWNGEPVVAVRVQVVVADAPPDVFPQYWARQQQLIGTVRWAVRVTYHGQLFYLDDEDGSGSYKVTHGGGPGLPHRDLLIERELIHTPTPFDGDAA